MDKVEITKEDLIVGYKAVACKKCKHFKVPKVRLNNYIFNFDDLESAENMNFDKCLNCYSDEFINPDCFNPRFFEIHKFVVRNPLDGSTKTGYSSYLTTKNKSYEPRFKIYNKNLDCVYFEERKTKTIWEIIKSIFTKDK